ncbi:uncharacterized protein [Apostichopus japonicus]|uniref:uncharacterized protein isoform X2 n=1 Tax=Stichopus japonicus TaxID=307972 RepID=UPI003AB3F80A
MTLLDQMMTITLDCKMATKPLAVKFLVTMVMMYLMSVIRAQDCCTYPSLETDDEYQVWTVPGDEDGYCYPFDCGNPEDTSKSRVIFKSVDVIYDARCRPATNSEGDCYQREHWSYIGLDISYTFTEGSNSTAIVFGLKTLDGAVSPTIGTMDNICHYISLNDTMRGDQTHDSLFHYTGFVGLHPAAKYELTARPMCGQVSTQEITVQDCFKLRSSDKHIDDYFCSKSTPASFLPSVGVNSSLFAYWTVWPEDSPFTSYVVELLSLSLTLLEKETIPYEKSRSNGTHMLMTHQFPIYAPGEYYVGIYAQPDKACKGDPHWPTDQCSAVKARVSTAIVHETETVTVEAKTINIERTLLVVTLVGTLLVLFCFLGLWLMRLSCSDHNMFENHYDDDTTSEGITLDTPNEDVLNNIPCELQRNPKGTLKNLSDIEIGNTKDCLLRSI